MRRVLVATAFFAIATFAHAADQPYAGQHQRDIKALSQEEVDGYMRGADMGLAKAAELNGYPGPMHVLELAEPLGLNASQREKMQNLMEAHKAEARTLGAEIVRHEHALARLFAGRKATVQAVDDTLAGLAAAQARLRGSHLKAHLAATQLLSADQVRKYAELRGYADAGAAAKPPGGHGPH